MTPELMVWLAVSVIGLVMLPFVWRRRLREEHYMEIAGATPARALLNDARKARVLLLSLGVMCGSLVPLVVAVMEPTDDRRIATVVLLVAEYAALVGAMVLDEWFAARIDKLGQL